MTDHDGTTDSAPTVVVGIDDSDDARDALQYAWQQAAWRGARLRVLMVFEPPEAWAFAAYAYGVMPLPDSGELRATVRAHAERIVDDVRASLPEELQRVPVEVESATGRSAEVLVAASRDAALLVVGHRGRGGVRSALLGSVGLGCVLHATCPVTVVPAAKAAHDGDDRHDAAADLADTSPPAAR